VDYYVIKLGGTASETRPLYKGRVFYSLWEGTSLATNQGPSRTMGYISAAVLKKTPLVNDIIKKIQEENNVLE